MTTRSSAPIFVHLKFLFKNFVVLCSRGTRKRPQIFNVIRSLHVCIVNMNISSILWKYHVNTAKLSVPKHTSSLSHIHVLLAEGPRGKCFAIKAYVVLPQNLTNIFHVKMLTFSYSTTFSCILDLLV